MRELFCDKHKWCSVPRDTWRTITSDRELGKVGGFSVTPKRVAVGTVAVLATVVVLSVVGCKLYKWYTQNTQKQFRSVGSNTEITQYYAEGKPDTNHLHDPEPSKDSAPFFRAATGNLHEVG